MLFIVGLGNPGEKHAHSRHNMGWRVIDAVAKTQSVQLKMHSSLNAEIAQLSSTVLIKPHTYMNLSGQAVKAAMKKFDYSALAKKEFHSLIVVYDDLDLDVGKYKLVFGSGPKVHNGVNNIKEELGSDQFWHVRIGVDGRKGDRSVDPQDYVLSSFTTEEQELIDKVQDAIVGTLASKCS